MDRWHRLHLFIFVTDWISVIVALLFSWFCIAVCYLFFVYGAGFYENLIWFKDVRFAMTKFDFKNSSFLEWASVLRDSIDASYYRRSTGKKERSSRGLSYLSQGFRGKHYGHCWPKQYWKVFYLKQHPKEITLTWIEFNDKWLVFEMITLFQSW